MVNIKSIHKPTPKGYLRLHVVGTRKNRMEHCLVWEQHYGKIPDGMQIHHKDFNKKNNNIDNLQLVTLLEHKRIHEGCKMIDGVWYKPCSSCGELLPCTNEYWYFSRGWISGRLCKKCYREKSAKNYRKNKTKMLSNMQMGLQL